MSFIKAVFGVFMLLACIFCASCDKLPKIKITFEMGGDSPSQPTATNNAVHQPAANESSEKNALSESTPALNRADSVETPGFISAFFNALNEPIKIKKTSDLEYIQKRERAVAEYDRMMGTIPYGPKVPMPDGRTFEQTIRDGSPPDK